MRLKLRVKKLELARTKLSRTQNITYCWADGTVLKRRTSPSRVKLKVDI